MKLLMFIFALVMIGILLLPISAAQQVKVDEYNYFSNRLQKMTEQLRLTPDQLAKLKPIIEQETAEMEQIYGNAALSRVEKLKQYWTIVKKSNANIKTFLTDDQMAAFESLQKEQKQRYDTMMQQAKKSS